MNKEQVLSKLKQEFGYAQLGNDIFDWEAEYDSAILPEENYTILKGKVSDLIGRTTKEMVKEQKNTKNLILEQQQDFFDKQVNKKKETLVKLFDKPKIIGLCSDTNCGKSMLLYGLIKELKENNTFNLFSYGLRVDLGEQKIYSVEELEKIKNSIIICDEFFTLFDLENRKLRKAIEQTIRLLFHNNNILVLSGTPDNFKKFIAAKLDVYIFKRNTLSDFINGSRIKNVCMNYNGSELGSAVLNVPVNEALLFDGDHYSKMDVPYYPEYDTKSKNVPIIVPKSVPKIAAKEKPVMYDDLTQEEIDELLKERENS